MTFTSSTVGRLGATLAAIVVAVGLLATSPAQAVPADTAITIEGGGWGHGIGMSQWGTLGMAQDGHTYDEILGYWYTGTGLRDVSAISGVPEQIRVGINYVLVGGVRQFRPFLWQDFQPVNGSVAVCLPGQSQGSCSLTANPGETWRYRWFNVDGGFCEVTRGGVQMYRHATDCTVRLFWSNQPNTRVAFNGSDVGRTFARGHIEFLGPKTVNGQTGFHLVVALGLQEYVYGIAEVSPAWHTEALKTQVVAARTYAAWKARAWGVAGRGDCSCQLVWDTFDQAYRGWHTLTEGNSTHGHRWKAAVDDTAGQVVVTEPGGTKLAETFYSSSTGGATENVWDVWGPDTPAYRATYSYLASKPDPWSERFAAQGWGVRWTRTLTAGQVATSLGFSEVTSMAIEGVRASGSPNRIRVTGLINGVTTDKFYTGSQLVSPLGLTSHYIHSIAGFASEPQPLPPPPEPQPLPPPPEPVTAVADAGFESGSLTASPHVFRSAGGRWSVVNWTPRSGSWHARYRSANQVGRVFIQANGATSDRASHLTVAPGDWVYASAYVKSDFGHRNRFQPGVSFYDVAGNQIATSDGPAITPTIAYRKIEVAAQAPADTAYAVFQVQLLPDGYDGNYWVDDLFAEVRQGDAPPIGGDQTTDSGTGSGNSNGVALDPGFESGFRTLTPHEFIDNGGWWTVYYGTPRSGNHHARYKSHNQRARADLQVNGPLEFPGNHIRASQGDRFHFSAFVKSDFNHLNRFRPRALFYDAAGSYITGTSGFTVVPTTSYRRIEVTATAPAGAAYVVFQVQLFADGYAGNYYVDDLDVVKLN